MKTRYSAISLFVFTSLLIGVTAEGQTNAFLTQLETLQKQSQIATNVSQFKVNATDFYSLAEKVLQTNAIPNTLRFSIAASAGDSNRRYLLAILNSSTELQGFAGSTMPAEIVRFLKDSHDVLAKSLVPNASWNVPPPTFIVGDHPDLREKANTDYEQRKAVNDIAAEELNTRTRFERSLYLLEDTLKNIVHRDEAKPVKNMIMNSDLPDAVKDKLLGN